MTNPMAHYYGGIEGGGTHSKIIVCDALGRICATLTGPATNHWSCGIAECARRIAAMVAEAKQAAAIPATRPLRSLGLSLSGCEDAATNRQLELQIRQHHPGTADAYVVCSDTLGSVATVSAAGALVLIAGTGSNALLRNPDGATHTCGGWGHMLGDEGSAWWIVHRGVKLVIDHLDGLERSEHDVQPLWRLIREHFAVERTAELLAHCYAQFDKCEYAKLCERLALAAEQGDALCAELFRAAGERLARATVALLPRVSAELWREAGALNVVCVGSVWKSWPLLRHGFVSTVERRAGAWVPYDLRMVQLTQQMAMGAVYMGVDGVGDEVPREYGDNYRVFEVIESATKRSNAATAAATMVKKANGNH